jgi:hypothetical protein
MYTGKQTVGRAALVGVMSPGNIIGEQVCAYTCVCMCTCFVLDCVYACRCSSLSLSLSLCVCTFDVLLANSCVHVHACVCAHACVCMCVYGILCYVRMRIDAM